MVFVVALAVWGLTTSSSSTSHGSPTRHRAGRSHATTPTITEPMSNSSSTLSGSGPGALPQTGAFPSSTSPQFRSRMGALFDGIKTNSLPTALPAFFPEAAYLQLKTVGNPKMDYVDRLLLELQLDIHAVHTLLGSAASSAHFVSVSVPAYQAQWVGAGQCLNSIGYFQVAGARLVYTTNGATHSVGIASMISWRGQWYVVHFGAISRDTQTGLLLDPSSGTGSYGPPEGC
jgi:hypothetical protein